jgi:hypothetical protein
MPTPYIYARQFATELQADLGLSPETHCPVCFITYLDGDVEGCCFYSYEKNSVGQNRRVLNCVYDFEDGASMKEVVDEWLNGVYKALSQKDFDLVERWKARFSSVPL